MDRRRCVLTSLAGAFTAPVAAEAQQAGGAPPVGFMAMGQHPAFTVFSEGLRDLGYIDGRSVILEPRFADVGRPEQFADLARDLVRRKVNVIVALLNPEIGAAKRATSTIPIVMVIGVDPVGLGFVRSLASPGSNVTGNAWDPDPSIYGKYIGFIKEILPRVSRIGALVDTKFPGSAPYLSAADQAAKNLHVVLLRVEIGKPSDIDTAFSAMADRRVETVIVFGGTTLFSSRETLVAAARQQKVPIVFPWREGAAAGGLLSFGPSLPDLWRRSAVYVDKILKGAKPGDLPIEQPTKFELIVNLKTARALGLTIPPSLLLRADQVIE